MKKTLLMTVIVLLEKMEQVSGVEQSPPKKTTQKLGVKILLKSIKTKLC